MIRRPPRSTLVPDTTLLRSEKLAMWAFLGSECLLFGGLISAFLIYRAKDVLDGPEVSELYDIPFTSVRSEEHTSELQSRQYLVCRHLLAKKMKTYRNPEHAG